MNLFASNREHPARMPTFIRLYLSLSAALLLLVFQCANAQDAVVQGAVTIPGTEMIHLYSPAVEDTFAISIAVPEDYDTSDERYPVVYVTDPYFVFGSAVESARAHAIDGRMPDAILVGIGYSGPQRFKRIMQLRTRDYTQLPRFILPGGVEPEWAKEMELGKAEEFLQFISGNLMPYVEQRYRTINDRIYVGHSGGGAFGTYVLFHEPELFDRYLLSSPAYWYGEGLFFEYEEAYARQHDGLGARLFLSVGENESHFMVGDMRKMVERLKSRNYEGFQVASQIFTDQTHFSVWPVAANRGLLVLFDDDAYPSTGDLEEIN